MVEKSSTLLFSFSDRKVYKKMSKALLTILLARVLPAFLGAAGALLATQYPTVHSAICVLK